MSLTALRSRFRKLVQIQRNRNVPSSRGSNIGPE